MTPTEAVTAQFVKAGQDLVKNLTIQPLAGCAQRLKQIETTYGRDTLISVLGGETDLLAVETGIANILAIIQPAKPKV